jgi:hypothetical protein
MSWDQEDSRRRKVREARTPEARERHAFKNKHCVRRGCKEAQAALLT